jgi:hypothetical protein
VTIPKNGNEEIVDNLIKAANGDCILFMSLREEILDIGLKYPPTDEYIRARLYKAGYTEAKPGEWEKGVNDPTVSELKESNHSEEPPAPDPPKKRIGRPPKPKAPDASPVPPKEPDVASHNAMVNEALYLAEDMRKTKKDNLAEIIRILSSIINIRIHFDRDGGSYCKTAGKHPHTTKARKEVTCRNCILEMFKAGILFEEGSP